MLREDFWRRAQTVEGGSFYGEHIGVWGLRAERSMRAHRLLRTVALGIHSEVVGTRRVSATLTTVLVLPPLAKGVAQFAKQHGRG